MIHFRGGRNLNQPLPEKAGRLPFTLLREKQFAIEKKNIPIILQPKTRPLILLLIKIPRITCAGEFTITSAGWFRDGKTIAGRRFCPDVKEAYEGYGVAQLSSFMRLWGRTRKRRTRRVRPLVGMPSLWRSVLDTRRLTRAGPPYGGLMFLRDSSFTLLPLAEQIDFCDSMPFLVWQGKLNEAQSAGRDCPGSGFRRTHKGCGLDRNTRTGRIYCAVLALIPAVTHSLSHLPSA